VLVRRCGRQTAC